MKNVLAVIFVLIALAVVAVAAEVHCFSHSYATCYSTGEVKTLPDGGLATKYHCSCGDDVWVR